jgi:hypothetical protein
MYTPRAALLYTVSLKFRTEVVPEKPLSNWVLHTCLSSDKAHISVFICGCSTRPHPRTPLCLPLSHRMLAWHYDGFSSSHNVLFLVFVEGCPLRGCCRVGFPRCWVWIVTPPFGRQHIPTPHPSSVHSCSDFFVHITPARLPSPTYIPHCVLEMFITSFQL